jgi:hypothetical protein
MWSLARRAEVGSIRLHNSLDPRMDSGGHVATARQRIREIIEMSEQRSDERCLADAWSALGYLEFLPARFDDAAAAFTASIEHYRKAGDDLHVHRMTPELIGALVMGSTPANEGSRRAAELLHSLPPGPMTEMARTGMEASWRSIEGDRAAAIDLIRRSMSIAEEMGSAVGVEMGREFSVDIERRAGDSEAAATSARRYYEALSASGDVGVASTAAAFLAEALAELHDVAEARRFAEVAVTTSSPHDFMSQTIGRRVQAILAARDGDAAAARSLIEQATALCGDVQMPEEVGRTWLARADVMAQIGDHLDAVASAGRALELFKAKGVRQLVERAETRMAALRD